MGSISDIELAEWLEQVADGLEAGLKASDAVALAKELPGKRGRTLEDSLRGGSSWLESIEQLELGLSFTEKAMLQAAEASAALPHAMKRIAEKRRDRRKTRRRILLAIAYPVFLLHFAALVFSIRYLIDGDIVRFGVSFGMIAVPVWLIAGCCMILRKLWPEGVKGACRFIPILSSYRKNHELGVFCETLGACLDSGMQVDRAWEIAVQAADGPLVYKMGDAALASIKGGSRASEGLKALGKRVPHGLLQSYRSGEETGSLVPNLQAAASRFNTDAKNKLFLASILYPKLLLVTVFGYIGYRILKMVAEYYQGLAGIAS